MSGQSTKLGISLEEAIYVLLNNNFMSHKRLKTLFKSDQTHSPFKNLFASLFIEIICFLSSVHSRNWKKKKRCRYLIFSEELKQIEKFPLKIVLNLN